MFRAAALVAPLVLCTTPALSRTPGAGDTIRAARAHAARFLATRQARDLKAALDAYARAAAKAPPGRAAAALLARARLLLEHRADKGEAHAALRDLVRRAPRSREARTARRLLRLLRAFDPKRWARRVAGLRLETGPAATRLVVELDGVLRELPAPLAAAPLDRVRVKLPRLTADRSLLGDRPGEGVVDRVRLRRWRGGLLLDAALRRPAVTRVFYLRNPHRLVLDLGEPPVSAQAIAAAAPPPPGTREAPLGHLLKRVVIDPGHGGRDPGAIGRRTRLREKDVTLRIARRLQALLRKVGVEALLTREEDKTASLRERTTFANERGADLFVSLHANSNPDRNRHGIETYYLDTTRDRYAQRLARRENRAGGAPDDLQLILADLNTRSNTRASMQLAGQVLRATVEHVSARYPGTVGHGAKPALFYVLLGARMPAILVETSYLTHPRDEARLREDAYLQRIAEGIFLGIRRFTLGKALALVHGK
jgi:N-acetylmuramoyl-L-alanine amidase